mgnify:CR=1 FL=1
MDHAKPDGIRRVQDAAVLGELHRPPLLGQEPGEDPEQGGLARAVGAEQAEDLARADIEVDTVERPDPTLVGLR